MDHIANKMPYLVPIITGRKSQMYRSRGFIDFCIANKFAGKASKYPAKILASLQANTSVVSNYIKELANLDPTPSKKYMQYILKQVATNCIVLPEDGDRIKYALTMFDEWKNTAVWKDQPKDINKFKTWRILEEHIHKLLENEQTKSNRALERELKMAGAKWIYEFTFAIATGPITHTILKVDTPEAADYYGKGTKWCTSSWENSIEYSKNYLKDGPLYIIFKDGEKLAQATSDFTQFMNTVDYPIKRLSTGFDYFLATWIFSPGVREDTRHGIQTRIRILCRDTYESKRSLEYPLPGVKPTGKIIK